MNKAVIGAGSKNIFSRINKKEKQTRMKERPMHVTDRPSVPLQHVLDTFSSHGPNLISKAYVYTSTFWFEVEAIQVSRCL